MYNRVKFLFFVCLSIIYLQKKDVIHNVHSEKFIIQVFNLLTYSTK